MKLAEDRLVVVDGRDPSRADTETRILVFGQRRILRLHVNSAAYPRIDRLAEREKRVLQTAGIIGRNFSRPLLERIIEAHGRVPLATAELDGALCACYAIWTFCSSGPSTRWRSTPSSTH
jgi:hypothetical protein